MTLTTFNSPQTMSEGTGSLGAGVGLYVGEAEAGSERNISPLPSAYGRVGLDRRWDAGVKVAPYVFFADLKYQLIDRDIDVAADLGVSYGMPNTAAVYPALFVGTERFYVGGRVAALAGRIESDDNNSVLDDATFSGAVPGLVAGAAVGDRIRLMPEVNVHFSANGGEPLVLPALGIQYRFGAGR